MSDDRFTHGDGEQFTAEAIDEAETYLMRVEELGQLLRDTTLLIARELHEMKALDLKNYPPTSVNSPEEVIEGAGDDADAMFARLLKTSAVREWKQILDDGE